MKTKMQGKENAAKPVEKESADGEVNETSKQRKSRQSHKFATVST